MKRDHAIKFVRELRRYVDHACKRPRAGGGYVKQALFSRHVTRAEHRYAEAVVDITKRRQTRVVWIDLAKLKATQRCLCRSRLTYQLRRYPSRNRPTVVKLPGDVWAIWDGHHRATAALLLGRRQIKCIEFRKA